MEREALIQQKETIAEVARTYGLRLVMLYGSVARARATAMSDIDIGVLGTHALSFEDEAVIAEAFARATGFSKIEVKSLHQVSPLFLHTVMREGIVLYEDVQGLSSSLALYAWKLATETRPMRERKYSVVHQRILGRSVAP